VSKLWGMVITTILAAALITPTGAAQRRKPTPKITPPPNPRAQQGKDTSTSLQSKQDGFGTNDDAIRLGTELVNVMFSAVDRNNRVISDLRQDEISVVEDGRAQQIFTFKREPTLPINVAIVLDLSGSQEYTFPQEKLAAGEFLRSIIRPARDSAAILTFQEDVELVQGLTSRTEALSRAFNEIEYSRRFGALASRRQATALYDAVYIATDHVLTQEDANRAAGPDSITRRAIILLTDGVDNASSRSLDEVIDRATRSGVIIYSIGIGDRFRFEGVREDILNRLGEETGGRAFFPRRADDLLDIFRQIESDLRSQYLVAYSPSNSVRDGRFRRVEVRLAARPDVRIVHQRGYYAPLEEVKR
jgi:Ca-activated chloride channel homolog